MAKEDHKRILRAIIHAARLDREPTWPVFLEGGWCSTSRTRTPMGGCPEPCVLPSATGATAGGIRQRRSASPCRKGGANDGTRSCRPAPTARSAWGPHPCPYPAKGRDACAGPAPTSRPGVVGRGFIDPCRRAREGDKLEARGSVSQPNVFTAGGPRPRAAVGIECRRPPAVPTLCLGAQRLGGARWAASGVRSPPTKAHNLL